MDDLELLTTTGSGKKSKKRASPVNEQSEVLQAGEAVALPAQVSERNTLNDLTAKEWIPETVSVWTQRGLGAGHPDAQIERQHPAPFSYTDVSRLVRFFSKKGQVVLDPFVGIGSTLKACAVEGRKGIGFELNPRYAELSRDRLEKELGPGLFPLEQQQVLCGDSRELVKSLPSNSVDFIVTSPPYWRILHKQDHKVKQERLSAQLDTKYSDDARDLGNIQSYDEFLEVLSDLFGNCRNVLKPKKYIAIVVGDFREKGKYHMFHADLANKLEARGYELKGIKILYQRHKKVFPYGYPCAYVPNLHHQYIVILQNGAK